MFIVTRLGIDGRLAKTHVERSFRRIKGYQQMPQLIAALPPRRLPPDEVDDQHRAHDEPERDLLA